MRLLLDSRLTTALLAAGIALATYAIWRSTRRRSLRRACVAAGLYGAGGFGYAAAIGLSIGAALAGTAIQWLPRVLQAVSIGAFVVLPLGWIVSVVHAGLPRLRRETPAPVYQAVALTLCVALVAGSLPRLDRGGVAANTTSDKPLSQQDRLDRLDRNLRAIADADRAAPRDRWDPDYVVERVGRDPQRLFAWVRDNTWWVPYHGVLRGPVGVLMDRQGNSFDRSLLLAALLEKSGQQVRLAHVELPASVAGARLAALLTARSLGARLEDAGGAAPEGLARPLGDLQSQFDRESQQTLRDLDTRVSDQSKRLLDAVQHTPTAMFDSRLDSALDALRDHWWVQRKGSSGDWLNDDPLLASNETASPAVAPADVHGTAEVGHDAYHLVTIRVIAERWTGTDREEEVVLTHAIRGAEAYGEPVSLQLWPGSWPSEIAGDLEGARGLKSAALEQTEWAAVLSVGSRIVGQGVISAMGHSTAAGGGPFAAIARGFSASTARGTGDPARDGLSAAWIEYRIHTPGGRDRVIRRDIFDLSAPAARLARQAPSLPFSDSQRLARNFALMMRTEILPVSCGMAPEFVGHMIAANALANQTLLRTLARDDVDPGSDNVRQLLRGSTGTVTPLLGLAAARASLGPFARQTYIDELNVLTRHQAPVLRDRDVLLQDATDIVANHVGVDFLEDDPYAVALTRGVFDTNAETMLGPGNGRRTSTATAFEADGRWRAVMPARAAALEDLHPSPEMRRRLTGDLADGFAVVAREGSADHPAWWRIDPDTGETLGIGEHGWGASLFEYGRLEALALEVGKVFLYEYGLCMMVPQAVNFFVAFSETNLSIFLNKRYVQPINPELLRQRTHRMCLFQAVLSGFVVTLPLLLMSARAEMRILEARQLAAELEAENAANKVKTKPGGNGGGTPPPKTSPPPKQPPPDQPPPDSPPPDPPPLNRPPEPDKPCDPALDKTQPQLAYDKTQPGGAAGGGPTKNLGPPIKIGPPMTLEEAAENYVAARKAAYIAQNDFGSATRDFVEVKQLRRAGAPYDPAEYEARLAEMRRTEDIAVRTVYAEEGALRDWKAAFRREYPDRLVPKDPGILVNECGVVNDGSSGGGGGFLLPSAGNENITLPGTPIRGGQAGGGSTPGPSPAPDAAGSLDKTVGGVVGVAGSIKPNR